MAIDWSILSRAPDAGLAFQKGFADGREQGRFNARESVLANYAANPTADALAPLAAVDPQAFAQLSRHERDRSDFAREGRGRAAYAGYLRHHEAGLADRRNLSGRGVPSAMPPGGVLNVTPGAPVAVAGVLDGSPNAAASLPAPDALAPPRPNTPYDADNPDAEIVVTGRRRVGAIPPSERFSLADVAMESPELADRLSGQLATIDKAHYAGLQEYFGAIGAVATRARELDAADRPAFIDANRDYLRAYGITDEDIDGFDDGDASLDGLIRLSMGAKDSLASSRADQNTASMIEDRDGRRALVARGQNMTDARGRYGIGVASADRQRGQNLASTDRRRVQDLTDRRVRETGGRRQAAGAGGAAGSPANAPKIGEVRQGYRYKGGNPSARTSWEKVR